MKKRWSGKKLPLGAANMTIDDVVRVYEYRAWVGGGGRGEGG